MPRALWSGAITFGLVNVPVRLYSAVSEHKLHFSLVHKKDESPIGYQKICKLEDRPVPDKEIVKAFELRKGEYVFMEDEDFAAARVEGYKTIDITDFVPSEQIDPCGVPKLGAHPEKSAICRQDANFGTPHIGATVSEIQRRDKLGGLIHEYYRAAA